MIIYRIQKRGIKESAKILSIRLRCGEVCICPTETVYGLCADAMNIVAARHVRKIKKISKIKRPYILLGKNLEMVGEYARFTKTGLSLARRYWPGALTLILPIKKKFTHSLRHVSLDDMISFRVSPHLFIKTLFTYFKNPIISTSANITGQEPIGTLRDAKNMFGNNVYQPTSFFYEGKLPKDHFSTLVDVSGKEIKIIRQGMVRI